MVMPSTVHYTCTQCAWSRLFGRSDALFDGWTSFDWCPDCGADVRCETVSAPNQSFWQVLLFGLTRPGISAPTEEDRLNYFKRAQERRNKGGNP